MYYEDAAESPDHSTISAAGPQTDASRAESRDRQPPPRPAPASAQELAATAPPPTAAVPALRFRPAAQPASSDGGEDDASAPLHGRQGEPWRGTREAVLPIAWDASNSQSDNRTRDSAGEASTSLAVAMAEESPLALRRPSLLFDTAVATDALFARVQQQRQQPQGPPAAPPPSAAATVPVASTQQRSVEGEVQSRHPSGPISSILGRPPPAPQQQQTLSAHPAAPETTANATSANPSVTAGEAYPASYRTPRRDSSSSSSPVAPPMAPGRLRSVSPTSTMDYVEIEHKQNELRHAVEHHVQSLERSLALRDEEVATLSSRLRKLEEDYQFNYNLIAERDAALEEAAGQLQRLYRELKRLAEESSRMEKTIATAETELRAARQRVREVEEGRDAAVQQVQRDYAVKERHLLDAVRAKEAAVAKEEAEQHTRYAERAAALETERASTADRSAKVTAEMEARSKQHIARLEAELAGVHQSLQETRQQAAEAERKAAAAADAQTALVHEAAAAQKRHDAALQEAAAARRELEERLVRVVSDCEKRVVAAEGTAHAESSRAACAELERTRLQATLAEAQERLQHLTARYDEDAARSTKERQQLLQASDEAAVAAASAARELHDVRRELEQQRRLASEDSARLRRELERAQTQGGEAHQELATAKESCDQLESRVQQLEAEVRRWKAEEVKTAAAGRQVSAAWEEKYRQAELQLQATQEEALQGKRAHQAATERAQGEAVRLTRELHASEAARRALENQFHQQEDFREERGVVAQLRAEKEQLQQRVTELEHTNAAVHQQVANFTAELQNDPILKAAKETQERVVQLQGALAQAEGEQQRLQDTFRLKEDELARLQTEMLRVQVLVSARDASGAAEAPAALAANASAGGGPASLSDHVSRALQRQQHQMRSEYSRMRESYEAMVRELERQRRHRRRRVTRRSRTASASSSSSSASAASSTSSPTAAQAAEARPRRTHRSRSRGRRQTPQPSAEAVPPALPDSRAAHLLQEAEVWRQRCVQLEQQLEAALRERDRFRRELQLAKQDVVALGVEKSSLVDLNSFLKAQLREAYRLRLSDTAAAVATGAPAGSSARHASAPRTGGAESSYSTAVDDIDCGVALSRQPQRSQVAGKGGAHPMPVAAPSRVRADEAPASSSKEASPVVYSTRGYGATTTGSAAPSPQGQAQQRLRALEQEIAAVRGQLAASSTAAPPPSRVVDPAVVRRGAAAVRHYGYDG